MRQTEGLVKITKEGSTKFVHFITPGAGIRVLKHEHITHTVKMHNFFSKPKHSSSKLRG